MSDQPKKPDAASDAKWAWGADDVEWSIRKPPPGVTPMQPLTPQQIAEFEENLRRIEAGLPLLNGNSPYPVKRVPTEDE